MLSDFVVIAALDIRYVIVIFISYGIWMIDAHFMLRQLQNLSKFAVVRHHYSVAD
jgi:hypothetical protein